MFLLHFKKKLFEKYMNIQSFGTIRVPNFGIWGKMTFGYNPCGKSHSISQGKEWCLLLNVTSRVKLVLEVVPTKFVAPFLINSH